MVINGVPLLLAAPIKDMISEKRKEHGVSWGLSEIGYDIRIKQDIQFFPPDPIAAYNFFSDINGINRFSEANQNHYTKLIQGYTTRHNEDGTITKRIGRTALASSIEYFEIPDWLWCEFRNKSTRAREFIDATLGTDGEPGWCGNLTIEIVFHGNEYLQINAGSGILKAVFHSIKDRAQYVGKYQNQADKPVEAIYE